MMQHHTRMGRDDGESHRSRLSWAVAGLLLVSSSCGGAREPEVTPAGAGGTTTAAATPAPEESRKLSRFVYIEEGTDLMLTVGVRVAAFHEDDAYFPLEISLTNKMKKVDWILTRESFRLVDEAGRFYDLPTQAMLQEGYRKRTFDSNLFEARAVTASRLEGFRQVASNFFPDPVAGIRREPDTTADLSGVAPMTHSLVPIERVELTPMTFMEDVIYFPHPDGELLEKRFSLEIRAPGLEEPARLAFRVPRIK